MVNVFYVENLTAAVTGISVCHTRAVSSSGQSSFCLFIAVRNEDFMSSGSELLKAGSMVNLELEDVEGEYCGEVGGNVPAFI